MDSSHHVVIVGGGFGGLTAAQSLRDAPVRVSLIDRRNFHLFQPLLYQVATGTLSVSNLATPLRVVLKHQKNANVLLGEMTGVDVASKKLTLRDGEIPYDTLIVAAGSEPHYFGHKEWPALAPGLKSIEEATLIRSRVLRAFEEAERQAETGKVDEWLTFVVAGAGPTGVELAGSLAEVAQKTLRDDFRKIRPENAKIILVGGEDRVLPTYPPDLSEKAEAALRKLGVIVRKNILVTDVQADAVVIGSGDARERIPTRTVLRAAGVRASPLGQVVANATGAALDKEGRIIVAPDLSVPGHPDVFVIGDLASIKGRMGTALPGVAQVALQEGRYVGDLIGRRLRNDKTAPFDYRHYGDLATIGRNAAVANFGWLRFDGTIAWFVWALVHLLQLAVFENRLLVLLQWAWNYLTWNRSDLLITHSREPGDGD